MNIQYLSMVCAGALLAGAMLGGCLVLAESHCANHEGDASCAEGLYCSSCKLDNNGCVAEMPAGDCHHPGAVGSASVPGSSDGAGNASMMNTTITDDGTGSVDGGSTQSNITLGLDGSTTGTASTDEDTTGVKIRCVDDQDCVDPMTPFCNSGTGLCMGCIGKVDGDAACEALSDGVSPICLPAGACVPCTAERAGACNGEKQNLVCDESSNQCVACTHHAQCLRAEEYGSGCHIAEGRCLDPAVVLEVTGGIPGYSTISDAVQAILDGGGGEGTIIVHELNGGVAYDGPTTIDGGLNVAIVANEDERPLVDSSDSETTMRVVGSGTRVYLEGLRLEGGEDGNLVAITGSEVYLDQCELVATIDDPAVEVSRFGGDGAHVVVRNSMIWANNDDASFGFGNNSDLDMLAAALEVHGASADIEYSTVLNVGGALNNGINENDLGCESDGDVAPVVNVRNSILFNRGGVLENGLSGWGCGEAQVSFSAVTDEEWTEGVYAGNGNFFVDESDVMVVPGGDFVNLFNSSTPGSEVDLHLSPPGETLFVDIAQREESDLPFDIDGDARPAVGQMDYAGADLPVP